jgi:hypothetical protein
MAATRTHSTPAETSRTTTSGWILFASVYLVLAGALNLLWGITALAKKDYFVEGGLVWSNLETWGWLALVIAAVQILGGVLIYGRRTGGMIIGLIAALCGTVANFTSMGAYPVWSLAALVCSLLVLWAVTVHWEP